MILTKKAIMDEINKGRITITPFNKNAVGPASVDLTLDNQFRILKYARSYNVSEKADYKKTSHAIEADSYTIKPGETVLGITREKITLPGDICAWIQGRSRFARLGLMVHVTASFIQPGISNKQVLEMFNAGPTELVVKAGTKICQFIFQRCEGQAVYKGKFKEQTKV